MRIAEGVHNPHAQLSRVALLYLLAVLSGCIVLMLNYLPFWVSGVAVACVVWRILVFRGKWSFPNGWQKALLVVACCGGIVFQFSGAVSLDIFVALLVTGLSLKTLEVYHNKSAQLFLYVSVLVLMSYLLYEQGFIASVLVLLQMTVIIAAIVAINSDHRRLSDAAFYPLKNAAVTLLFAMPLLAFLFVVMPRMAPLWAMPLQKQQAKTGMSDEMNPGDINQLAGSAELVFRAGFSGVLPPQKDLYWRGVVLDEFDGRRWKNQCDCNYQWRRTSDIAGVKKSHDYSVMLEPHGNLWLFVLDNAGISDKSIWTNGEGIFRFHKAMSERIRYDISNQAPSENIANLQKDTDEYRRYLALPMKGNPAARDLATHWRHAGMSDEQVVQKALEYFHQSFSYTLEPPLLGANSVDDFLFASREGFCEYFASAFVFLMRSAGIPARVVIGYMGGERNEEENYVTVRQYDAHAWAEVWLPQRGWVRVDPTAAVAPERIEQGFSDMFPDSSALSGALGLSSYTRGSLLGFIRMKLDYMDYMVGRWVLDYDSNVQQSLFKKWGLESPWRLLAWFLGAMLTVFVLFLVYLQMRERHARLEHPVTAAYRRLCTVFVKQQLLRQPAETPLQFALRVQQAAAPEHAAFMAISQAYDLWSYSDLDKCVDLDKRVDPDKHAVLEKHAAPESSVLSAEKKEVALRKQMNRLYWRLRYWR